ncbi:unnamed protein product [Moneuplotes crassus]|uniref:Uncharacterized protein n=1 Tax=Euplotes crassus TaxID=5936 RepID=A0AAD1XHD2_EUPCR|nr:unnamed protein product [Moneuplotes crassus]
MDFVKKDEKLVQDAEDSFRRDLCVKTKSSKRTLKMELDLYGGVGRVFWSLLGLKLNEVGLVSSDEGDKALSVHLVNSMDVSYLKRVSGLKSWKLWPSTYEFLEISHNSFQRRAQGFLRIKSEKWLFRMVSKATKSVSLAGLDLQERSMKKVIVHSQVYNLSLCECQIVVPTKQGWPRLKQVQNKVLQKLMITSCQILSGNESEEQSESFSAFLDLFDEVCVVLGQIELKELGVISEEGILYLNSEDLLNLPNWNIESEPKRLVNAGASNAPQNIYLPGYILKKKSKEDSQNCSKRGCIIQ